MNIVDQLLANSSALDQILSDSWAKPAGPLATALGLADKRRIVSGHDVLDLAMHGRVWLVLSGAVQLFLVDRHGRYPVTEIKGGGLIDSFNSADPAVKVIGVPDPGTEVAVTTRAALNGLAARASEASSLAEAWQSWFETLKRLLPTGHWAPDAVDSSNFDKICDTAADTFLAEMLSRRETSLRERVADRKSAEESAEHDFQHGLDSVVDLVSVATAPEHEDAPTVATAALRVARALGLVDLSLRRASLQPRPLAEAVPEICQDNRLQFRVVGLEGEWWKSDHGSLLATVGPDATPGALLRVGKRYVLHAGGRPRVVDARLAATVTRTAYSLYAPFPNENLTGWRLLRFGLLGGRRDVVTICFTLLLTGLFSLVTPLAAGWLMDPIIPDAEHDQVLVIAGLLLLLAIGMTASFLVESLASLRLESMADNRVQAATWIRVLNLRPPFFRRYTAGDLANRADGINAMRRLVSQSTNTLGSGVTGAVFSLALMVYYEWRVALLVTIICIVFGGIAYLVGRRVLHYNFESLDIAGRLEGTVLQLLGAIAKLRIAGAEHQAFLRWLSVYRRSVELSLRQRLLANRLLVARSGFGPFITVVVLIILGVHSGDLFAFFHSVNKPEAHKPLMSTADFVSFNVALGQLIVAAMALTRSSLFLAMLHPYYRRVRPILEAPLESVGVGGRIEALQGELELRDVRFRYTPDSPLALRGLSLKVPAGKFVALVGPSGAGKSSIVRLLLGFDEPESGDIYIDGTDIRLLDLQEMRRHFGVVLQNGRLLAGSIYDNVCAGLPVPEEKVMDALRIAGLDDVVKALPMGVYTNVADGGAAFSGGQRQRLLIARAVLRRPQVLILDEATSALDNVTQRKVVENLRELHCTQVVVAQRLSTIESADLIYVLDEGRVVESGTYLELLQKGPLFKQLAERQLL